MSAHHKKVSDIDPKSITLDKGSMWTKLWMVGAVLAVVGLGGAFGMAGGEDHEQAKFWTSYLTGFMFALSLGLGGLFFVIIQHLVRANWSVVVRRISEHALFALPVVALFGIPVLVMGDHYLFEWTHTEVVDNDPMLSAKASYLNEAAASYRFIAYLVGWGILAFFFTKWSFIQDSATGERIKELAHKQRWLAPVSVLIFAASMSFGAFDFMMSLDPHWFSTMFGVYYFAGLALTHFALLTVVCYFLQRAGYLKGVVTNEHFHDLGKFQFGFTVFWTYIAFSQYFLIWYANIPEETFWFSYRGHGDWLTLSLMIVFGRFVLPWFALLRRPVKRNPSILVFISIYIIATQYLDMFFLIQPPYAHHQVKHAEAAGNHEVAEYFHHHIDFGASDVLCLVGFIGVFLAAFGFSLAKRKLVPINDPRLEESINHENF